MYKDSRFFVWKERLAKKRELQLQLILPIREVRRAHNLLLASFAVAMLILVVPLAFFQVYLSFLVFIVLITFLIILLLPSKKYRLETIYFQCSIEEQLVRFYHYEKNLFKRPFRLQDIDHFYIEEHSNKAGHSEVRLMLQLKEEKQLLILEALFPPPHPQWVAEEQDLKRLAHYLNQQVYQSLIQHPRFLLKRRKIVPWEHLQLQNSEKASLLKLLQNQAEQQIK